MEVVVNRKSGNWEFNWEAHVEVVLGEIDGMPIECTVRDSVCPEVSMTDITERMFDTKFKTRHWVDYINDLIRQGYESGYKSGYDKGYSDCEQSK